MSFYIGLSILSNNEKADKRRQAGRRILSVFEGRDIEESDIGKEDQGRPFFKQRHADFNISHSGSLLAVSYIKRGDTRTGCDIEFIRTRCRAENIAKNYFSSAEYGYIFSSGTSDETRFFEIWTLKECYLKLRGLSVFDMKTSPSFIKEDSAFSQEKYFFSFGETVNTEISFYLYRISNSGGQYMMAVAIEGEDEEPEIKMFSQISLDCKRIVKIKAAPNPEETVMPKR
ncbi:MAG: 4'-phosphopantetheinyl transferase superfamily protein [Treponema sp.]|nr:4'-phosphopantetheinyl transferase superfamily protein [Treponema sp.]